MAEKEESHHYVTPAPSPKISLPPSLTPPPRRLSAHFHTPTPLPVKSQRRLSWLSLQGRLIGADEATSAKTIAGGLTTDDVIAWDLFTPIHRVLVVAIVAVATTELNKSKLISTLRRSVQLRDQVLSSMQQKLDDLCKQVNTMKDRPETLDEISFSKNDELNLSYFIPSNRTKHSQYGYTCEQHQQQGFFENTATEDGLSKFNLPQTSAAEQEERRMSDLSDWASSVTSSADNQLNTLAIEQDVYNLQKECREKDGTIEELSVALRVADIAGSQLNTLAIEQEVYNLQRECREKDVIIEKLSLALRSANTAHSKRISELEDVVRRRNLIITKLKKDMAVLEQKVVYLVRLRRPSSASTVNTQNLPLMTDNLLYDMDSTTSQSSSDSDSELKNQRLNSDPHEEDNTSSNENDSTARSQKTISFPNTKERPPKQHSNEYAAAARSQKSISFPSTKERPSKQPCNENDSAARRQKSISFPSTEEGPPEQRLVSPLKENPMNQRPDSTLILRPKRVVSTGRDTKASGRHNQLGAKPTTALKRRA